MNRRKLLRSSTVLLAATPLAACTGEMEVFPTWNSAQQAVLDLLFREEVVHGSSWNLSQVLQHLAQSIEFSMHGFPELKNGLVRALAGNIVFPIFNARGAMSHSLDEPIPGAAPLLADQTVKTSVQRLLDAMDAFAQFRGTLQPHFAYGELSKAQYERAHLMHLANHWSQFQPKTAVA